MVKTIQIILNGKRMPCVFIRKNTYVYEMEWNNQVGFANTSFDIEIVFNVPIISFRNHDYTWVDLSKDRMANWYTPKILKLQNGLIIQANRTIGIWEVKTHEPNTLFWRFNPLNSNPLAQFSGANHLKHIVQATNNYDFKTHLALLCSPSNGIEVSRSFFPFSAILCFTDHCDFDTLNSLVQQRAFFSQYKIKITKGFFLNPFSKRKENASYTVHEDEYLKWMHEGHELAYHSLSQSLRPTDKSIYEFKSFVPPTSGLSTWIDHGFQPYNFSMLKNKYYSEQTYENLLIQKQIEILWNYLDIGTATEGVINQINPDQFTFKAYKKGIRGLPFLKQLRLMVKNGLFYFADDESKLQHYKQTAFYIKRLNSKIKLKYIKKLLVHLFQLLKTVVPFLILYPFNNKNIYPLAKYSPLFFRHKIADHEFMIFQSLEILDFKKALNKKSLDILVAEKGVCIAHTYFSVPMPYHHGKIFKDNHIDKDVEANFKYLEDKILNKELWNPTLKELIDYIRQLEQLAFYCNEKGEIILDDAEHLNFRKVS